MQERVVEVLRSCKNHRDLPRVVEALRVFEPPHLFEVLFPLSVQKQAEGKPVAFGAFALNELNPPCPLSLEVAIESLLPNWDVSIEEVVFYLAKQFGEEAVANKALALQQKHTTGTSPALLKGIAYWANIYGLQRQRGSQNAT